MTFKTVCCRIKLDKDINNYITKHAGTNLSLLFLLFSDEI